MRLWNRIVYMSESGGGGGAAAVVDPVNAGGGTPAFAETLPEDIRGEAAFRDIKDLPGLAKSYFNATKLIGARPEDVIRLPTNPDDAEAWSAVHARLGRPESPDKYGFTPPKLPEGVAIDEKLQTGFAGMAHKAGLTTKQASALYDWYNGAFGEHYTANAAATAAKEDAAIGALKTEWGAAFDQNLELAKGALAHYGDKALADELVATRQGNNPALLKLFAKLGSQLSEDGVIGKASGGGAGALSPAEAKQQINGLRGDTEFSKAYMDGKHPGHKEAVAKMADLHTFAYPPAAA